MALSMSPSSATVSSASGTATFRWTISGTASGAVAYGLSSSSGLFDDVGSGRSGSVTCGVGTHRFYAFWEDEEGYRTGFGNTSVTVTYSAPVETVTATKRVYLNGTYSSSTTQSGLYPGGTFTPSSHAPSAPSGYTLNKIMYGSQDVTTGSITCPSSNFTLDYYYVSAVSVDLWDWAASNGEATAVQTAAAYSAVTGGGSCADFSYLVWNDMCAKVKEVLDAAGIAWVTKVTATGETLLSYGATRMTSSDRTLTAARFNALRFNVGANYTTGIAAVETGDAVLGSYFTTLMEKVNEWIETL